MGGDCLYSLSVVIFSRSCTRGIHSHRRFYKSDPEWIKFLKKVNYELSMNIFFNENEAKQILKELSELGK